MAALRHHRCPSRPHDWRVVCRDLELSWSTSTGRGYSVASTAAMHLTSHQFIQMVIMCDHGTKTGCNWWLLTSNQSQLAFTTNIEYHTEYHSSIMFDHSSWGSASQNSVSSSKQPVNIISSIADCDHGGRSINLQWMRPTMVGRQVQDGISNNQQKPNGGYSEKRQDRNIRTNSGWWTLWKPPGTTIIHLKPTVRFKPLVLACFSCNTCTKH